MLRISILLPDLRGGGAERVMVNLANGFVQRGYAVDVVLLSAVGEFLSELLPEIRVVDLQVKRGRWALLPILHYLQQTKPTVLLACMWPLTVIAVWVRMLAHISTRVMVAEHTTWSIAEMVKSPLKSWQVRSTMHYTFPRAHSIVTVSKGSATDLAHFANLDRNRITTIYNPVVSNVLMPKVANMLDPKTEAWWSGSHFKILAVGTLKKIKDYATLISAFALLRQQMDARLLILGEGECRIELEAQVRRLGIEDSLFMPGFSRDTNSYYQRADLHVLSSIGEGLPTVIIEALAAGTPVVSTDCLSGPREILSDGQFGRLVPVGDAPALAAAMFESLAAKHDTAILRARAQDFSIDKAVDLYLDLLFPAIN